MNSYSVHCLCNIVMLQGCLHYKDSLVSKSETVGRVNNLLLIHSLSLIFVSFCTVIRKVTLHKSNNVCAAITVNSCHALLLLCLAQQDKVKVDLFSPFCLVRTLFGTSRTKQHSMLTLRKCFPGDSDSSLFTDSVCWKLMQVTLAPSCTTLTLCPGQDRQACHWLRRGRPGSGSSQHLTAHASSVSISTLLISVFSRVSRKKENMNENKMII